MTMKKRTRRKPAWVTPFLDALRASGVVSRSADAAGVGRQTVYGRRSDDPEFAERWDDAINESLDAHELNVQRLAMDTDNVDPSTRLRASMYVLSRRRPEKWGDREKVEVSGPGGSAVNVESTVHLPDAETWAQIIRLRGHEQTIEQEGA